MVHYKQPPPREKTHILERTHMCHVQTLTYRTNRSGILWYVLQCTRPWGRWISDDPACKTMAAKFTKCLESWSGSLLSLAQTNPQQPVCAHVENRSPPAAPARVCKHASIFPVCFPPILMHTILSGLHHFLFYFILQADRRERNEMEELLGRPNMTRLPGCARAEK